ncbi:MAG TPA: Hpt domain-containing protein [Drouetiella sp.]
MEEGSIAALPPVNIKELEEALEVEGAREIAAGFMEDVANVPSRLTTAIQEKNKNEARSAAHLLKGCCLIIFSKQTAELASDMEKAAIAEDFAQCETLLPSLLASLDETIQCLQNYLDEC